jgi:hypothetical protein
MDYLDKPSVTPAPQGGGQFFVSPRGALPQRICYRIGWLPQQECYPGGVTAGVADGGAAQHGDTARVGGSDPASVRSRNA